MTLRNKEEEGGKSASALRRRHRQKPHVTLHVRPMDEQQERRLNTAVDALLAELVRQEMGRAK